MDEEHLQPHSDFAMDEEHLQPHFDFLPNQRGARVDNGGDDRLSALPNEILLLILSYLPVRRAASTTLLSSRWLDLWKQIPNLKFNLESDRISQLPDQIISLILSSLTLKKAAATSVLSSRWSNSWKHTPNLDFTCNIVPISGPENSMVHMRKYIEIVNSILQSHKALSLKQFRICFHVNKSAKWSVTKWLEFVFLRKVESLELDFQCRLDRDKVVLGESLREINTIFWDLPSLIFFQFLKSLHLVSLVVSGQDVELFVCNCPSLEKLMICDVSLTSDIEVRGPSLKRLEIYMCRGGKSIKVSAPNLTFIKFHDDEVGKLLFENVRRPVEAVFIIRTSEFIMHHFASAASSHISQLQYLKIDNHCPKVFWTNPFPQMPNLKKLSISCFEMYNPSLLLPVTRVIWASPRLEEFTLAFSGSREAVTPHMQEILNVGRSPHQHLKVFRLSLLGTQTGSDHVVELVTYISNNFAGLRRICIRLFDKSKRQLLQSRVPNHIQLSFN